MNGQLHGNDEVALSSIRNRHNRELVQRVAASPRFRKSHRLRDFLLFICENAMSGNLQELREQQIGHRVYGRRVDYNTAEDNIVRVEARRLRRELESYFDSEGRDEPVIITIPKGAYIPEFEPRANLPADLKSARASEPAPSGRRLLPRLLPALGIGAAALLLGFWIGEHQATSRREGTTRQISAAPAFGIWPTLLDTRKRTNIVMPDASLSLRNTVLRRDISLEDYITSAYLQDSDSRELRIMSERQLVGFGSTTILWKLFWLEGSPRDRISVRHARALNIRDFHSDNHILLGSRQSNPWVELFERNRNFRSVIEWPSSNLCYRNTAPARGEQDLYRSNPKSGEHYTLVSYLPNLSRSGNVLLIEGTGMAATEAAWAFVSDLQGFKEFLERKSLVLPGGGVKYFEVLLRTTTAGGAHTGFSTIASRPIDGL